MVGLNGVQSKRESEAASRPSSNTGAAGWLNPDTIEKYRMEKDRAAIAEEKRRAQNIKDVNLKAKLAFDEQVRGVR